MPTSYYLKKYPKLLNMKDIFLTEIQKAIADKIKVIRNLLLLLLLLLKSLFNVGQNIA